MFVGGDEHQFGARLDLDVGGGAQAGAAGHLDVENDQIGPKLLDLLERLVAVLGLAADFGAFDIAEESVEAIERQRLVVDQQYTHAKPSQKAVTSLLKGKAQPVRARVRIAVAPTPGMQMVARKRSSRVSIERLAPGP